MSDIFSRFDIFLGISDVLKIEIKRFFIFDDNNGLNILFVTNDDNVYGFGSNQFGCCGVGSNSLIEPQIIPELYQINIKQFFNGFTFVLALDSDNQLYGWGGNGYGQLGRGYVSTKIERIKPNIIEQFKGKKIIDVSCGSVHALALTSDGTVYGWGNNAEGQIGCGQQNEKVIPKPIELKTFSKFQIKSIYCCYRQSFALTNNGFVYSWGENSWCSLGHQKDIGQYIFEPTLINISNIISICPRNGSTYFLSHNKDLYFCGYYKDENNQELYQKRPKLLNTELEIISFHSSANYQNHNMISLANTEEYVYRLYRDVIEKTEYKTTFDFFSLKYQMTGKTIELNENKSLKDLENIGNRFERFENLYKLSAGEFGTVFKVKDNNTGQIYAIKQIELKDFEDSVEFDSLKDKVLKEVNIWPKSNNDFIVGYFDSWFENNMLYIQMEFCSNNLKNIIKQKSECFGRQSLESMNSIEYFISCQLFKELLECVQYLHELNPPIIHRDIKPANVLIKEKATNGRFLKLCDFGISTFDEINTTTRGQNKTIAHSLNKGTPQYMAPEVSNGSDGKSKYSTKADIYSLSIISSELFDFDINSSDNRINKEIEMRPKSDELRKHIGNMLNPIYRLRPTCAELLSSYKLWSINESKLIENKSKLYLEDVMKMREFSNKFFYEYFKEKVIL